MFRFATLKNYNPILTKSLIGLKHDTSFFLTNRPVVLKLKCFNAFHAAGVCRRQVKHLTTFVKMSKLWNFMTIFRTIMKKGFR